MHRAGTGTVSYSALKPLSKQPSLIVTSVQSIRTSPDAFDGEYRPKFIQIDNSNVKLPAYQPLQMVGLDVSSVDDEVDSPVLTPPNLERARPMCFTTVTSAMPSFALEDCLQIPGLKRNMRSMTNVPASGSEFNAETIKKHQRKVTRICGKKVEYFSAALLTRYIANQHMQPIHLSAEVREGQYQRSRFKLLDETYYQTVQNYRYELGARRFNERFFKHFAMLKAQLVPSKVQLWQISGMKFNVENVDTSAAFKNDKKRVPEVRKAIRKGFDDMHELFGRDVGAVFFDYLIAIKWQNSGFKRVEWRVFEQLPVSQLLPQIRALIFFAKANGGNMRK